MIPFFRAARGVVFLCAYAVFLVFGYGLPQRLVVWPLATLLPRWRTAIVGWWFRRMAGASIGIARVFADVRLRVQGEIPAGCHVVVMNHQSLLDIPVVHAQMKDPYPLIPTRALYAKGIPGISLLIRMGRYPLVRQTQDSRRDDLRAIARAAESVARGEQSLVIFPEGHRTRDGEIGPFMRAGLRIVLQRAKRPVYLMVLDGLWRARTTADTLFHFAGSRAELRILGPIPLPEDDDYDAFIDRLHARMTEELRAIRAGQATVSAGFPEAPAAVQGVTDTPK